MVTNKTEKFHKTHALFHVAALYALLPSSKFN